MKKNHLAKAFFSLLLMFIVAISSVSFASAGTLSSLDKELLDNGYPQSIINQMDEAEKIQNRNNTFISATEQNYDENGLLYTKDYSPNQEPPVLYGAIKDTTFSLLIKTSKEGNNIRVNMTYRWTKDPYNRYQDAVGFSWDSNVVRVVDNSFKSVDYYKETKVANESTNFASVFKDGCGYYAKLQNGFFINKLHGTATFLLEPLTSSGSSQVFVSYFHRLTPTSLTIDIPFFGSIGLEQTSGYDERANVTTFNW